MTTDKKKKKTRDVFSSVDAPRFRTECHPYWKVQWLQASVKNIFFLMKTIRNAGETGKGKGKAIPLQTSTDPEGSRRLRLPDFKTIGT